jgi:histidinol-phosphate aminotransferase
MKSTIALNRRKFMGGIAALAGYCTLAPQFDLPAQQVRPRRRSGPPMMEGADYENSIKLCFNENPFGPPPSVMQAMTQAFKYAGRYAYPDGGLVPALAALHGVSPNNILLGAGSSEILELAANTFLGGHKKVLGVEPTFSTVYEYAAGIEADSIRLPLGEEYRTDIPAVIRAAKENRKDIGFVYLCNPNNPTGLIVTKQEIKQLLDGLPEGIPVLIDEAYHHFVEDPQYATSTPYVAEGRPVIIARTFSKIAALAGMRIGYAVAPEPFIEKMGVRSGGMHVNALAKWGAAASLKDVEGQNQVRSKIIATRKKTTAELESLGFKSLPSEANFFMVALKRPVIAVIREFARKGILVGRPFPPMMEHMRVSVGTDDDMARFLAAFKQIVV